MKEKVLGEWITALKSGMYTQLRNRLEDRERDNTYCCLGVLSVVTSHRSPSGHLMYPDCDFYSDIPPVCREEDSILCIPLNDEGPLDNYSRVVWLLETAPELFISE